MKITTKLFLLGLVGITAAPFIVKKQDGTPYLTFDEARQFTAKSVTETSQNVQDNAPTELYRWQDAQGNWHFSDKPSDQYSTSTLQVEAAINSMEDIELPEKVVASEKDQERFDPTSGTSLPLTTAPLDKVPDMLKEIERVKETMKERQKVLDNL